VSGETPHLNVYGTNWKNPYPSEHRIQTLPAPTRTQRLASCMRTIGHPLSIMREWPEVSSIERPQIIRAVEAVGIAAPVRKAQVMAEQKAVAAHRAGLKKSIEKLAARRDIVKAELEILEGELKTLLSMLKVSGYEVSEAPIDPTMTKTKGKKDKGKGKKPKESSSPAGPGLIALRLVSKGTVTPTSLAEASGQNPIDASNTLGRLARAGTLKRVSRGVYGAA